MRISTIAFALVLCCGGAMTAPAAQKNPAFKAAKQRSKKNGRAMVKRAKGRNVKAAKMSPPKVGKSKIKNKSK